MKENEPCLKLSLGQVRMHVAPVLVRFSNYTRDSLWATSKEMSFRSRNMLDVRWLDAELKHQLLQDVLRSLPIPQFGRRVYESAQGHVVWLPLSTRSTREHLIYAIT